MSTPGEIAARKADHLRHARGEVEVGSAGWADVDLVHVALPEFDLDRLDLSTEFLGCRLDAPIAIAAMTGGHADSAEVNARLARAAERHGIAIGVGSQRAALRDAEVAYTYEVVRKEAPTAFLIGNVGAAQLVEQIGGAPPLTTSDVEEAARMIGANAMAIHLNFLEEVVQPEGDRNASGCLDAFARLAHELDTPVIAKETGAGISPPTAQRLVDAGAAALDVGGRGGTSFAAVEGLRATERGDLPRARLGETFRDWGIPTAVAVAAAAGRGVPVIATGGVRSGLDAAKALALGASLVALGRPLLLAALRGESELEAELAQLLLELRVGLFLAGCALPEDAHRAAWISHGTTREWLAGLGLPTAHQGA